MDPTIWDYVYHISRCTEQDTVLAAGVASKQFAVMNETGTPHGTFPKNPLGLPHTSMDGD